jgi:nucleoside-diphosphate-sugar epimerase
VRQYYQPRESEADPLSADLQQRVLVTGATGKIGRHVVTELLARGYAVRALTSKPPAEAADRLEWCRLDFQESLEFDSVVQGCAAVIHLGAEMGAIERMQRSNVEATRALAAASERAGVKVFCYTSSVSVYGSSRRRPVAEASPVLSTERDVRSEYWANEVLRCYGRTKLQGEFAIAAVAQNVEYVIFRPTVVVDIDDLVKLRDWSKARKAISASQHPHHIFVHDVVDAILWFMERGLQRDGRLAGVSTFNLSDDSSIRSYSQIFRTAYSASRDEGWHVKGIAWPVQWLSVTAKYRALRLRQPFGRMVYSGNKVRSAGYTLRFGMDHAVAVFCEELTSQSMSVAGDRKQLLSG